MSSPICPLCGRRTMPCWNVEHLCLRAYAQMDRGAVGADGYAGGAKKRPRPFTLALLMGWGVMVALVVRDLGLLVPGSIFGLLSWLVPSVLIVPATLVVKGSETIDRLGSRRRAPNAVTSIGGGHH